MRDLEEGSGTMAAAVLVMVAGMALAAAAAASNLAVCQSRARAMDDLVAFGSARSWWLGESSDPCAYARDLADANAVTLSACAVEGEDVRLTIAVRTKVPGVAEVSRTARAGPVACGNATG